MTRPILTKLQEGQSFFDEPVYAVPLATAAAVNQAYRRTCPEHAVVVPVHVGHERVRLRWVQPDGEGGFVPREDR